MLLYMLMEKELLYAFLVALLVFFILATFIILIVRHHSKKVDLLKKEKDEMRIKFEKGLLQSQLEVEENTRRHIAQELHDNLGSLSSLIKINLGLISDDIDHLRKNQLIDDSRKLIKDLTLEIKHLAVRLNAERFDHSTLQEMLATDIGYLNRLDLFKTILEVEGEEVPLPGDKKIILYRICQELLNNCLRHANPKCVKIIIRYQTSKLEAEISDDGSGFDQEIIYNRISEKGSGLINMQARARLLNGSLHLESSPGRGTFCKINIPLTK